MSFTRVASVGLLLLGACSLDENVDSVGQNLPALGGCDDFGCGANSPEIDSYGIHDFDGEVGGAPNKAGLRVVGIEWTSPACTSGCIPKSMKRVYSAKAQLGATDGAGTFVGVRPDGTNSPNSILGLRIFLQDASGSMKYEIKVSGTGRYKYWAQVTGADMGTSYFLEWDVVVAAGQKRTWENVCTDPPSDGSPDLLGMNSFQSIVFEDDAIDSTTKRIKRYPDDPFFAAPNPNSGWINVGCAGHALAKLHLSGHTTGAVKQRNFHNGTKEFQATLKMIVADYCASLPNADGTPNANEGYPFTVAGQPLQWLDAGGENTYSPGFLGSKEAEWTASGATCLNKPRVNANPTVDGMAAFPDLEGDIVLMCGSRPKECTDDLINNLNGSHIVSSNPL